MSSTVKAFKCPNCGAPLDVNPEDAVFNCVNCGQAILADGSIFQNHYVLENRLNEEAIHEVVKKFIKKKGFLRGIKNYKITQMIPMLLPFWCVVSDAYTHFVGYERYTETETYTTGTGKNRRTHTRTYTLYRPIDREIREERVDVILGRYGTSIFGYEKAKEYLKYNFAKATAFHPKELKGEGKKFIYLSTEMTQHGAEQLAKTIVFDDHRARAEKACTKVLDCATQVSIKASYFVHVPVWEIEYEFKDQTYRIAILGDTGAVLAGEIPITLRYRVFFGTITFLLFVGGLMIQLFTTPSTMNMLLTSAAVAIISYFTLRNVFKPMSVVS